MQTQVCDKAPFLASTGEIATVISSAEGRRVVVIIPAYNEAKVIEATLESLRNQTVQPTTVIVAANNCSDGTEEIAYRAGALVFLAEPNRQKKAGALNLTLEMLMPMLDDKDFVLVADADTQLSPNFIEIALRNFETNTFVGGVGGAFEGRPTTTLIGTLQRMEFHRYLNQIERFGSRAFVLSGTGTLFSVKALRRVKKARVEGVKIPQGASYYDTDSLTEDNEITLALLTLGWRCLSPKDMRTTTDVMDTSRMLRKQRERWYLGALWNLYNYGLKMPWRMRYVYWRQQIGLIVSVIASVLLLLATVYVVVSGTFEVSTLTAYYLAGTVFVMFERLRSVWSMGRKARLLVISGLDQMYSMYLTAIFATVVIKFLRGDKGDWIPT